jgi:hypothetical protein
MVHASQKAFRVSFTKTNCLIVFREIITVLWVMQNPCKKWCGQNAEFLNVEVAVT